MTRVTFSDLAKYSRTRSIARPLCDSWASYTAERSKQLMVNEQNKNCYSHV